MHNIIISDLKGYTLRETVVPLSTKMSRKVLFPVKKTNKEWGIVYVVEEESKRSKNISVYFQNILKTVMSLYFFI